MTGLVAGVCTMAVNQSMDKPDFVLRWELFKQTSYGCCNDEDFGEHLEVTADGRQRGTYDVGGAFQCLIYPTRDGILGLC